MDVRTCRGCGATITFIKTGKNSYMPCEVEPVEFWPTSIGNKKFITSTGVLVNAEKDQMTLDAGESMMGYVPHWILCPQSDEFRRK